MSHEDLSVPIGVRCRRFFVQIAANRNAALHEQFTRLTGITGKFGPEQRIGMSFGQLADRLCGVFDRPTVGKTVQQIERTGRRSAAHFVPWRE